MIYPLSNVIPEPRDARDFLASVPVRLNLPDNLDQRNWVGPVENQLNTGSCVANSGVSCLETPLKRAGRFLDLSRLQLYWDIREGYEALRGKDGGAYLSDAFKSASKLGIAPESAWPFDVSKVNVKPTPDVYEIAQAMKVERYERVAQFGPNIDGNYQILRIQSMLAMGYQVAISMAVSPRIFEMTGKLTNATCQYSPLMVTTIAGSAGGHAMHLIGWLTINGAKWFIVKNSWGVGYGYQGYFLLHPDALKADGYDAWMATKFAGIEFEPDWSAQPAPLLTATLSTIPTQYKAKSEDVFINTAPLTVSHTGGDGPFSYKWTASDPSVLFMYNGSPSASATIPAKTKSVTITCTVTDSSIPTQQIATASTLVRVVGTVDIESNYGKAFRLYRAAFGRTPDPVGLAYWVAVLDAGASLFNVAQGFIGSPEFRSLYTDNPSNRDFALLLYTNVLHRAPDESGLAWWVEQLDNGAIKADVLIGFSESPENKLGATW